MESLLLAIQHLFPTVLRMSLSGSILVLIVVGFRFLLQKAPKWLHCLLWVPVAMRLLFPTLPASPVSLMPPGDTGIVSETVLSHGMDQTMPTVEFETPWDRAINRANEAAGQNVSIGTSAAPGEYLPFLWVMGTGLMLLYALVSTLRLRREVSVSLRQRGNIRVCDAVASPFILGILRPVIYLPSSLSGEEKRFVLAHERAHLRRLDHIWKPLGFLILSVHWFNPFCWLAYVLLCRDMELACDEKVIRELGRTERAAYSQTLLNCSAHRVLAACPVAFGEADVKRRVKAVLNYKKPAFWIILSAVLACVVLIVCFAADPMQKQDLSFLNYKNAIPLIGQNDTAPTAFRFMEETGSIQPGVMDSKALVQFLESANWSKRGAPSQTLDSAGSLEIIIEDGYQINVFRSPRLAMILYRNEKRFYRIGAGDYEAALAAFIPAPSTEPDRLPEEKSQPNEETTQDIVSSPSDEEEERIIYMLSEVAEKTGPYALSEYTDGQMDEVVTLCMQLQYYARDHRLSADQMRGLMLGTLGLDGAYAEAFAALLAELHALDPLRFVAAYFQADESVQPFLWELYGNLDHIYPPEELAREYAAFSQIYNNMTAYLRTEYGLKYENLAPKMEDMQLYRCVSMPTEPVEWFFEGVVPEWAVQVILDHAGNSKLAVGVLTVYFGSPDEYTDDLPLGAYLKNTPESAYAARLAVRLNDSSLAYLTVPAELAGRIERKIETGSELPGISRVRMDGWGEQYAQGIDVPDLYYYPAYDRDRSTYLTILRNADGQYGIDGREADEEIRALLTLLQRETGWNVFSDPTDFTDLTQIDVFFCGTPLTSVRDEAHLDAFEELISEGSFASYASKTPNEIVEIRCTRADGSTVTLATDPEAARFWLPPFNYYRYDAYEQEPRTGALLKALGLDGWPSMDTVDLGAVREMNERLLPTLEGWKSAYGGNVSHVETHEVESAIYSQEDIGAAIELIKGEFQESYNGCTLTEIYYAGDEYTSDYLDWADRTGADEVIVLLSSFDVDSSGGDGSLNPNSTYDRWNWILVRTNGGPWRHVDHGHR